MEAKAKILVVDDDKEIADLVEIHLVSEGYGVRKANDAVTGLAILRSDEDISLAILDIMMPGMDGLSMVKKIRETSHIPVIMLSAKSTDLDKIVGLGNGADDYVTKPFNPLELTARVKANLRRFTEFNSGQKTGPDKGDEIIEVGPLYINKSTREVRTYDKEAKLTPIEYDILCLLAGNPGRVFSTDDIFTRVWNEKAFEGNNTVMVHIRRLREKIEMDARNAKIIKTVWGVGYKIEK